MFYLIPLNNVLAQQNEYWLQSGDIALKQANLQIALKNYNYFIENNSEDPIGYLHRAKVYSLMGRNMESKMDILIAQRLNPLSLMYVNPSLRSKYSAKKSFDFNYKDLSEAFVKSPSRYKDYKKIFEDLDIAHSQDALIEEVIYELNNKNIDKAEDLLSTIKSTELNQALLYDLYGKIHLKRLEYRKAIESFSKAIDINPKFSIAYHNRGLCYKLTGDLKKAEDDLKSAIDLNSDISLFYFTYAKLNEKKGKTKLALEHYSKALEIDEDYEEALINYSQLLKGLGEYETAISFLDEVVIKNPNNEDYKFHKANLYFVYGDFDKAIKEYRNFLDKYPRDKDALFNLGLSEILIRKTDKGCTDIENSLEINEIEERRYIYNMLCN
jgi:tetratricopeptide (TPR) repeat protein